MNTTTYRVKCKNCKKFEDIVIDDKRNIYWKPVKYIISGRYRLDMNWGWQCICGNNDLLTKQEKREISDLADPDPQQIADVVRSLIPDKSKFIMETI